MSIAIDQGRTIEVNTIERTYQFMGITREGAVPTLSVRRERVTRDTEGSLVKRAELPEIVREAPAILSETVTLADSTVISAAQIIEALPLFFDRWGQEPHQTEGELP